MLSYGGKKKKYTHTHTHTHTHTRHPSSRFLSVSLHQMSQILCTVTILSPFIPLQYWKRNLYLSVCVYHSTIRSLRETMPSTNQGLFPLPHSICPLSRKTWSMALPSLAHALLPIFPTLFYLISLLATTPTHREFFIIRCKLLAETTC